MFLPPTGLPLLSGRASIGCLGLLLIIGSVLLRTTPLPPHHGKQQAERDGQSEAIATNLTVMAGLRVPIVTLIMGEGGSGGALGVGMGNRVGMLSRAYFGVVSFRYRYRPCVCFVLLLLWAERKEVARKQV